MKKPLIAIIGPTATGKSDLAVEIALRVSGEVLSADSRQVYRGLDVGTGKITKEEMKGVPHHLLNIADPRDVFTVTDYKKHAEEALAEIYRNGNTPILAGGTGLYIDTILYDLSFPEVPPNNELREKLSEMSEGELFSLLNERDPDTAETIDRDNKRRLIRALEIIEIHGQVPPQKRRERFSPTIYYLDFPDDILRERIATRLDARLEGMVKEATLLHKEGLSFKRMKELGLEYRFLADYLEGVYSLDEMRATLQTKIWQYAKRQRTWFKKYKALASVPPLLN